VNHSATTLNPFSVAGLHITHTYSNWHIGDPAHPGEAQPLIAGDLAYAWGNIGGDGGSNGVKAFHLPGGRRIWEQACLCAPIAISDGVLYTSNGEYSAVSGQLLRQFPSTFTPDVVSGSRVFGGLGKPGLPSTSVGALDASTGQILWSANIDCTGSVLPSCIVGGFTVADGRVYVLSAIKPSLYVTNSYLNAYSATSGAPAFTGIPAPFGRTAVSNGVAYVSGPTASGAYATDAFDGRTGSLLWTSGAAGSVVPVSETGIVVISGFSDTLGGRINFLTALSTTTGRKLWSNSEGGEIGPLAIANGVVYVMVAYSGLEAVDEATGRILYASGGGVCVASPFQLMVARNTAYAWCEVTTVCGTYVMTAFGL